MQDEEIDSIAVKELVFSFLDRYTGNTQDLYRRYLNRYINWCYDNKIEAWHATRMQIEEYVRYLVVEKRYAPGTVHSCIGPVSSVFKLAHADGLIPRNPTVMIWLPKDVRDPNKFDWYNRMDLARWIKVASTTSPRHHAVGVLSGMLALRVSEIAGLEVNSWKGEQEGYPVLSFIGKGGKHALMPLDIPILKALSSVAEDRKAGPLIPKRNGGYLTRGGMTGLFMTISRRADLPFVSPHGIRRSCITAALDLGIPIRDVQNLARHTEIKTTFLYDRNGQSLSRHASHSLSSWLTS